MKVTSMAEALALEKEVSTEDCVLTERDRRDVRRLYLAEHGLTTEGARGHDVHHLCRDENFCMNIDHLCLMTASEHLRLHKTGKKVSAATRRKMSLSHIGLVRTEEHKKNLSLALKGNKLSESTKRKLSLANKGKKYPAEVKQKQSLSGRIRWAKKRGDYALAAELQKERDLL